VNTLLSPTDALNYVLANAGASKSRDSIDNRLVPEVKTFGKEGELISDETASPMNGPGTITGGAVRWFLSRLIRCAVDLDGFLYFRQAPKDTDGDGIPDSYER
jgi:hypothetical protein